MWEPRRLTILWASRPVTGIALPFLSRALYFHTLPIRVSHPEQTDKNCFAYIYYNFRSRDRSGIMATGDKLDGANSIPGRSKSLFSPSQRPDRLWIQGSLSPGAKQSGHEAYQSPPSSTKV
jgi:hypothetical protein